MKFRKVYGQTRVDECPFCGKQAVSKNSQGVPVCVKHKDRELLDLKCVCGGWLDLRDGKFGPYFFCMSCGNVSFRKAIEMNPQATAAETETGKEETRKKNITITSDDVDLYYS